MIQSSWLPERIRRIDPNIIKSGDAQEGEGISDSGQRYILKASIGWHPLLPASEWLCHGLAHYLHLPVPVWQHCILPDGRDAFGSRLESVTEREYWPTQRPVTDNPDVVSRTYVLDLFVGNADRHHAQWLITEAGGGRLLRPIDYSRAWFWRWPLKIPPFGPGTILAGNDRDNSHGYYAMARAHGVLLTPEALYCWDELRNMPKDAWKHIVGSVPPGWIPDTVAREMVNWWWSPQWMTRIKWIETQL